VVTDNYLASVLDMQLASARANVLPALKVGKIIDQDGKTLERAKQWRDDDQYAKVCKAIRSDIYPRELLDAIPDPLANRQAAERWFANHTGAGTAAVGKRYPSILCCPKQIQRRHRNAQSQARPPSQTPVKMRARNGCLNVRRHRRKRSDPAPRPCDASRAYQSLYRHSCPLFKRCASPTAAMSAVAPRGPTPSTGMSF
jgi:hypothetical protein